MAMERTSSLDLFRGSDAFSSLAFLDSQEASHVANSCQTPAEGLQPSQAIPASMPVSSLRLAAPAQRPSSLLHTSRLAPGFSAWPQTASIPYTSLAVPQPATDRHGFLPFATPAGQHAAGSADCQADSFAALLADDTALGFADDCFRRESDLYLPQERAVPAEAAHHESPQGNANETSFCIQQPQDQDVASKQPAAAPASTQPAATESAPEEPTIPIKAALVAVPQSTLLQSPATVPVAQGVAAAQPPVSNPSSHLPQPITKDSRPLDALGDVTAADAQAPPAEAQAVHPQLQPAQLDAHTLANAPAPVEVDLQTDTNNPQQHGLQGAAGSSPGVVLEGKDAEINTPGATRDISPRSDQSVLRPSQHPAPSKPQTEAVLSPGVARTPSHALDSSAQPASEATLPDAAVMQAAAPELKSELHAGAGAADSDSQFCQAQQPQEDAQGHGSLGQQQVLGNGHSAAAIPKLAVQDYQMPHSQIAQGSPARRTQTHQDPAQPAEAVVPDVLREDALHAELPQDASTSQHRVGPSGTFSSIVLPLLGSHVCFDSLNCPTTPGAY